MAAKVSFDTPIQSGDQSFGRVLNAGLPVATLFWSGAKLDPALESELAARARADAGKLLIVKIKTEDNPELVGRFGVQAASELVTFREGREMTRVENPSPSAIEAHLGFLLGRGPKPLEERSPRAEAGTMPGGQPITVTDATFSKDVMQSGLPVVVDFWAPWCGPCRMVSPALERIATDYRGKLRIAKLNVDENPITAQAHMVQGIPTLLFVKNGRIADRVVGALPEAQIRMRVKQFLRV